ncbi:hypothetical protein LAZ67_10002355 [Cordylochernes scorpioides]|uniref:DUF5641 domain-containing protein n=1 Tax=Cordylochernes scorpioides TaxID=51811 RepID=A0ABY6KYC6_9ARAC|nr:hypothetical protein LAZ67_10002355 [Cordylochernes scorpioides]
MLMFLKESHGQVQELRETIRQRFGKEYLGNKTKSIKEGNVVLMEVNNKERTEWPIGAIEKIYPGKDGIVRFNDCFFFNPVKTILKKILEKGRDLEKKKLNLDTPNVSKRSIRGKDSPVITRSGRIVKPPDRY